MSDGSIAAKITGRYVVGAAVFVGAACSTITFAAPMPRKEYEHWTTDELNHAAKEANRVISEYLCGRKMPPALRESIFHACE